MTVRYARNIYLIIVCIWKKDQSYLFVVWGSLNCTLLLLSLSYFLYSFSCSLSLLKHLLHDLKSQRSKTSKQVMNSRTLHQAELTNIVWECPPVFFLCAQEETFSINVKLLHLLSFESFLILLKHAYDG